MKPISEESESRSAASAARVQPERPEESWPCRVARAPPTAVTASRSNSGAVQRSINKRPGSHSIRAIYVHSPNYSSSRSPLLVQTVGSLYYVSPTGSDSNLGTLTAPFLTINHGVRVLLPGDTLYIRGGTYAESLIDVIPSGVSWSGRVAIAPLLSGDQC